MNRMQEWLHRAASELGLRIVIGHAVALADGSALISEALFPDLGNPLGMLVFQITPEGIVRQQLIERGFGYSTFSEPGPNEAFDIAGYAEMFV